MSIKKTIKRFQFKIIVFAFLIPMAGQAMSSNDPDQENTLFDHNKTDPISLLLTEYGRSQILALGESNHENYKIYTQLLALLQKVGNDPHLKYIIFERPHDNAPFYEELSAQPLTQTLKDHPFTSPQSQDYSLCSAFPAAPYTVAEFFPKLQEINQKREAAHPIQVITVDGTVSTGDPYPLPPSNSIQVGNCQRIGLPSPIYDDSFNREADTKSKFENLVWPSLKSDDKVIILYHYAHLIQNIEACMNIASSQSSWSTMWMPLDWFELFLASNPSARKDTRIVLFDEKDGPSGYSPDGTLNFTVRQSKRNPGESFGVELAPFAGVLKEQGLAAFTPTTSFNRFGGNLIRSSATLPEMVDAVVWNDDSLQNFALKAANYYLPSLCDHP